MSRFVKVPFILIKFLYMRQGGLTGRKIWHTIILVNAKDKSYGPVGKATTGIRIAAAK